MTYEPMKNNRAGFDPVGAEWGYILDDRPNEQPWRGMVPLAERPFTWPYQLHADRYGRYGSARLAPDWAFYAWRNEYVLASWDPSAPHVVDCRTMLERRYAPAGEVSDWPANPFAGEGNDRWRVFEWRADIALNLLAGTCRPRAVGARGRDRGGAAQGRQAAGVLPRPVRALAGRRPAAPGSGLRPVRLALRQGGEVGTR